MKGSKGWRWGVALFAMLVIWIIGYACATSGPSNTVQTVTAPTDCSLKDPRAKQVVIDTVTMDSVTRAFEQAYQANVTETSVDSVSTDYVSGGSYFKVTIHFQDGRKKSMTAHVMRGATACEIAGQMEWSEQ